MIVTKAQLSAKLAGSYPQMRLLATDNTALRLQEGVDGLFPRDAGNPQPFTFFLPASPYSFTATSASPAVSTAVGSSYANGTPGMLFINHSCEPNVGFAGNTVLVAMRDISPGEELTSDYALFDDYAA